MEHSFMLFSQLSAPSSMTGSAAFQLLTSHYRPSWEHAALWLETNVWALITIWRENEIQGQLNLAVSRAWRGAWEAGHQATAFLILKSFIPPPFPGRRWLSKCLQEPREPLPCTGAGAASSDQLLWAGQPLLLHLVPGDAVEQTCVGWEQSLRSFCLNRRPGGLCFATTRDSVPAGFGICIHIQNTCICRIQVSDNILMHSRVS